MNTANITRQLTALNRQQDALDAKRDALNKSVGNLAYQLRMSQRKRLVTIAKALGCTVSTYWRLEQGLSNWTPELLAKTVSVIKEGRA